MNKPLILSVWLTLFLFAGLDTSESSEGKVKSNVSYTSVTELGFIEADEKLVYGDANPDLQYGLLWLPENLQPAQNGSADRIDPWWLLVKRI